MTKIVPFSLVLIPLQIVGTVMYPSITQPSLAFIGIFYRFSTSTMLTLSSCLAEILLLDYGVIVI